MNLKGIGCDDMDWIYLVLLHNANSSPRMYIRIFTAMMSCRRLPIISEFKVYTSQYSYVRGRV
jgi:hypothetical protein